MDYCRNTQCCCAVQVPGNFHISTHASREQPANPDMSHEINAVTFGDSAVHVRCCLSGSVPFALLNLLSYVIFLLYYTFLNFKAGTTWADWLIKLFWTFFILWLIM